MSDTTTTSAAEVMYGRRQLTVDAFHQSHTVDDMLAWLVQRCEAVETKTWPGRSDVMLWSSANGWPDEHTAPTLHAALEAAVIAVGRAG